MEYLKGAITDPCENIISEPISTIVIIKGASKYFALVFRKNHMSIINAAKASIYKVFFYDDIYFKGLNLNNSF